MRHLFRSVRYNWLVMIALVGAACIASSAQTDVATIIRKSVDANNRDWAANPEFDYFERDINGQGNKTYQDTMLYGSFYQRLVEINGKKLSSEEEATQQRKLRQTVARRKAESPQQRKTRIVKFEADRRRDHTMLSQLTEAFNFELQGEQELDGHKVYVLRATPRHGYRPPNRDCQVLPGMEGTLWIDEVTFQWVKVEAHVIRPVAIEGFIAKVEPGTRFELEKAPVEGDVWLPTHFAMTASAKVLDVLPHHSREDDTYFNYRRREPSQVSPHSAGRASNRSSP